MFELVTTSQHLLKQEVGVRRAIGSRCLLNPETQVGPCVGISTAVLTTYTSVIFTFLDKLIAFNKAGLYEYMQSIVILCHITQQINFKKDSETGVLKQVKPLPVTQASCIQALLES